MQSSALAVNSLGIVCVTVDISGDTWLGFERIPS